MQQDTRALKKEILLRAKQWGFCDKQLAILLDIEESDVYALRTSYDVHTFVNTIDTLAAEYPAQTNYLYTTYNAKKWSDTAPKNADRKKIIIIGSGVYRIGSSVEFDFCAVTTAQKFRELGYTVTMINHNPETVSTDYDMADTLYFDELNFETVREIYNYEKPYGIVISMGGQASNNIAMKCFEAGMRVLGTSPKNIDRAENRHKFSQLLHENAIDQPEWKDLTNLTDAVDFAKNVGFPVLVRPSYVLSGAATLLEKLTSPEKMIYLDLPEQEVIHRLSSRFQCKSCSIDYGLNHMPKKQWFCDNCKKPLEKRKDDNEASIKTRIKAFNKETLPLLRFYNKKVLRINADQPVEAVAKDISSALAN